MIIAELREYAEALDKDRGHNKSRVTYLMREAADEIERLRAVTRQADVSDHCFLCGWRGSPDDPHADCPAIGERYTRP